jgi:hypothetical protein
MSILDDQVREVVEDTEKHPSLADWAIEMFIENMNNEYAQLAYSHLEIADALERFAKALRMTGREITIKIRITPEMLEKIIHGDFSDIHRQVEEKIRSLLA